MSKIYFNYTIQNFYVTVFERYLQTLNYRHNVYFVTNGVLNCYSVHEEMMEFTNNE